MHSPTLLYFYSSHLCIFRDLQPTTFQETYSQVLSTRTQFLKSLIFFAIRGLIVTLLLIIVYFGGGIKK